MLKYLIISLLLLSICTKKDSDTKATEGVEPSFEQVHQIIYTGTEENPIYSIRDLLVVEDKYLVLDKVQNKVFFLNENGEISRIIGREGRGPSEFLSPEDLIYESDSTFFVLDGFGNFRVQNFSMNGELIRTFPVTSYGPFTNSHFVEVDNQPHLFVTTVSMCKDLPGKNCIIDAVDLNGKVTFSMGVTDELHPHHLGIPFFSAVKGDTVFIVNVYGSDIHLFNLKGESINKFNLSRSSNVQLLDLSSMPTDLRQQLNELQERSYTSISGLFVMTDYIAIENIRRGDIAKNSSTRFLDIWDYDGNLVYSGLNGMGQLYEVSNGNFYFAELNSDNEFGELTISFYQLN